MQLDRSARDFLYGSRLFFPLRRTYQRLFRPEKWQFWEGMMNFYRPFIKPGSLVFDVGANVGTYCQIFLQLGARVIAIEPNADCCRNLTQLQQAFPQRMSIENVGLGESVGTTEFHVCDDTGLSTMNADWIKTAGQSEVYGGARWNQTRTVPITTLDALCAKYGVPAFLKIDVEGYEDHVLAGLKELPKAISFEFHPAMLHVALKCLGFGWCGKYQYNYAVAENSHLELAEWVSLDQMRTLLPRLTCEFGDVLMRL